MGCTLLTLFVSAGGARGESLTTVESKRVVGKIDRRVLGAAYTGVEESTREGLDLGLVTSVAYDDNIFQSSSDKRGDLVVQVEPQIGWTAGKRREDWVRIAYEGAAVIYLKESEDSRMDHRVLVEGGFKRKRIAVAYSGTWARLGSPSADLGGQSDRQEWEMNGAVAFEPKGKWSYEVFGRKRAIDQESPAVADLWESSVGVTAKHRFSPKTRFEVGLETGETEVDGTDSQQLQRLRGEVFWAPRAKFNLSLGGGVEYRDYQVGSGWDPYLAARAEWLPRSSTAFYLEAYRREESSVALIGENYTLTGLRAGVSQKLKDGWSAGLEFGRESADYFAVDGSADSGREDVITFIRPSVRYRFGDESELIFLYQWSENDSTDPSYGYANNQLGVSLNYRF
ncbi:MAG: hypothetical protein Q7Q71_02905 [Verrucomicrobiota bacterium JB023]|nr:hypothetical protein [Verrucomicrobiota bacterium JB023]